MTAKKKKKPGRPAFEITAEVLEKVETLAGQGLTQEQIARCLGINRSTLFNKKAENKDFFDAIKNGQAKGIEIVTNALMENAKAGNPTAQIFYLKNRSPNEWKDRNVVDHSGHIHQTHTHRTVSETDHRIEEMLGGRESTDPAPAVSH